MIMVICGHGKVMHGHLKSCSHAWSCMVMYGHVLSCMVMGGPVWSCTVMNGFWGYVWNFGTTANKGSIENIGNIRDTGKTGKIGNRE